MKAKILYLACLTIDPPPVVLTTKCLIPEDISKGSTAQDLALWAGKWIDAYGCEKAKRKALLESWPK
jgi:hypothetical protein